MAFNNNPGRQGPMTQTPPNGSLPPPAVGWKELTPSRVSPVRKRRRRIITVVSIAMLAVLIFAALRLSMVGTSDNDTLQIRLGDQQGDILDLRQNSPISPYLFGTNVFPLANTQSFDGVHTGFMHSTPLMTNDLQSARIDLLRYPGGEWGEQHILSYDQLNDFSKMLDQTNSDGLLQAHLTGPVNGQPQNDNDLHERANFAGNWVDYMNNAKSILRQGIHAKDAFHPVKFWTVGNEPDLSKIINPDTKNPYTVAQYVAAFIEFSKAMHQNAPTIKVFGPEISQFYGIGAGPTDANGALWMEQFLQGVGSYERSHAAYLTAHHYQILDGVSFHRYQFLDASRAPAMLASSSDEWNYLIPQLRQAINHYIGRNLPIAITEINTNPSTHNSVNVSKDPTRGQAALWWADTLGTLMNQQIEYTAFFSTEGVNSPYPLFSNAGQQETPMYRVMQLFSHLQANLVSLPIQREPIGVYATEDNAHQTVSLMFVNKSNIPQQAQIAPTNQLLGISQWHEQDISIAGDSIVVLTLYRDGQVANAYSYGVPAANDPQVKPLSYTECGSGNKKDVLAAYIPC